MTKPNVDALKENAADHLNEVLESASGKAQEALDAATEKAQEACCVLTESVKQKPLVYLGFALAVGIALGAVFLSRRSD
jgi:ElaB/YqjD/DUF883 family membrane-anchored ribosome-binding protein